jgi:hypothetical protein
MRNVARPWMLVYTFLYGIICVFGVRDNVQRCYPIIFTIWSVLYYLLIFIGNLIYSLDAITLPVRKIWKLIFPIIIIGCILDISMSFVYGKGIRETSVQILVIGLIIYLALLFPTFWAHCKLGYGKETNPDVT